MTQPHLKPLPSRPVSEATTLAVLDAKVRELGEAFNINTSTFADAFENIDARMAAMFRVIGDQVVGATHLVRVHGLTVGVDWQYYFEQYQAMLGLVEAVKAWQQNHPPTPSPPKTTPIPRPCTSVDPEPSHEEHQPNRPHGHRAEPRRWEVLGLRRRAGRAAQDPLPEVRVPRGPHARHADEPEDHPLPVLRGLVHLDADVTRMSRASASGR